MNAVVNINGVQEIVEVSVYIESCFREAQITLRNDNIDITLFDEASGGGDEYGYEYTAEDLISLLSSNITT